MKFGDLKKRFVTSSIMISLVVLLLGFSSYPLMRFLVGITVTALAAVAIWEYVTMLSAKGIHIPSRLLVPLGGLLTYSFVLPSFGPSPLYLPIIALVVSIFLLFMSSFHKIEGAIIRLATAVFCLLYIAVPMGLIYRVLYPVTDKPLLMPGIFWVVYLVSVTKMTDFAAYFAGKLIGRHKMAPKISPGKTWEGTCFGVAASTLLSLGFFFSAKFFLPVTLPLLFWIAMGVALGVIGLLGDLAESLIKRDCAVKDSNSIPGLGGILDMMDSLLFAAPFFYVVMGY